MTYIVKMAGFSTVFVVGVVVFSKTALTNWHWFYNVGYTDEATLDEGCRFFSLAIPGDWVK